MQLSIWLMNRVPSSGCTVSITWLLNRGAGKPTCRTYVSATQTYSAVFTEESALTAFKDRLMPERQLQDGTSCETWALVTHSVGKYDSERISTSGHRVQLRSQSSRSVFRAVAAVPLDKVEWKMPPQALNLDTRLPPLSSPGHSAPLGYADPKKQRHSWKEGSQSWKLRRE